MKTPNRFAILIALCAIICLSIVGMRVLAQPGSRNDAFTLTLSNAKLHKHVNDPTGFESVLTNAHAHYCVRHTDEANHPKPMHDPDTTCNLVAANDNSDGSEIILVDDQASSSTPLGDSTRGPSVTQTISTSLAGQMNSVLSEFQ